MSGHRHPPTFDPLSDPANREEVAEVRRLIDAGWKHVGDDLWIKPGMHNPLRRDSALKLEAAFDRVFAAHPSTGDERDA